MDTVFVYNTPHLMSWDWRIAADLFLGGAGAGAFLVAVLNSLWHKDRYSLASKAGAVLSPLLIGAGICFMLTELGHPFRLHRTLTGFNATSPLSWGGPLQGLMILVGLIYAYLWMRPGAAAARRAVGIIGIPVALAIGAYHGWLLAVVAARPLWNTGFATLAALVSLLSTGSAAVLLVLCLLPKGARRPRSAEAPGAASASWRSGDLRNLLLASLVAQAVTVGLWVASLGYGPVPGREALAAVNAALGGLLWLVAFGLGLLVPLALLVVDAVRPSGGELRANLSLLLPAALLVLAGGFAFRFVVIVGGQLY